ncbi:MAG: cytochrome c oxidase assembly protein [Rhizobiaceae bacterium]
MTQTGTTKAKAAGNARIAFMCLAAVGAMVGLAYASVPLYSLFCQVTGYGGTTRQAVNADGIAVIDQEITVRFDANSSPELKWKFAPDQRSVTLRMGEVSTIHYHIDNPTSETLYGTATFNVSPQSAGSYFNKIECFCFTETEVKPGERLEMPVVFFVDPEMADNVEVSGLTEITLSYTFFPSKGKVEPLASSAGKSRATNGG